MADAGVRKGFIILKANDQPMRKVSDLEEVMKAAVKSPNQVLFLTGVFPSGKRGYYAVDLTQEWFSWKVLCQNSPQSSTEQSITEFFTTNQQLKIVSVLLCVLCGEYGHTSESPAEKVFGSLIIAKEIEKRVPAINQSVLFLFILVDNNGEKVVKIYTLTNK